MLDLPVSTEFNKRIPKQKFYENIAVTPAMKKAFVEQIKIIYWRNKIATTTLNLAAGGQVMEIEVFEMRLSAPKLDESVLRQIDREIPYHILFLLEYEGKYRAVIGYKEAAAGKTAFKVDRYYSTDWMDEDDLPVHLEGLTLDAVLVPFKNVYQYTPISKMVEEYRNAGISWKYTTALVNPGEKIYVGSTFDGDGLEIKIYKRIGFIIKSVGQIMKEENLTEKEVYDRYAYCIYQTAMPQSSIRPRVMEKVRQIGIESDLYSIEYVPKTGRNKGNTYEQFYKGENFRLFAWLKDVAEEINGILYKKDLQGTLWDFVGETKNLTKEGDVPFPNGKKPVRLLKQMLTMLTSGNDYVLDFFSGSATTAHAVMQLNAEDGGHRKFIMVQLPEKTDEKSEAYKAGYKNICEIGKERIRRAGKQILSAGGGQLSFSETQPDQSTPIDIGFRCLRLDSSNMENVYYTPEETRQQDLFSLVDNVKPDRTPEDLLFQVMLDLGVLLSSPIEVKEIAGKKVFNVADGFLLACFDHDVTEETVKAIAQMKPYYAVFRDSSMANDSVATNFDQIFETYSPETVRKVL